MALVGALAVVTGIVEPVAAASNGQWSIYPADSPGGGRRLLFSPDLVAGHTVDDWVIVTNQSDRAMRFLLYAADAHASATGDIALRGPADPKRDMGAWVRLPTDRLELQPRSAVTIPFEIVVPAGAEPGDHAGAIVAQNTEATAAPPGDVQVTGYQAVGVRIYGKVAGAVEPDLDVSRPEVEVDRGFWGWVGGPVRTTVTFDVTNTGNQRLTPTAGVELHPTIGPGAEVPAAALPELLPGATAPVTVTTKSTWAFPWLSVRVHAHDGAVRAQGSTGTPVVPWALLAGLGVLGAWAVRRRRRRGRTDGPDVGDTALPAAIGERPRRRRQPVAAP